MDSSIGAVTALLGTGMVIGAAFMVFMVVIGYPLIAISAVRRLRDIHGELQRLNDTIVPRASGSKSGPMGI